MEIGWVAIALGDVVWISIAFLLGLLARSAGLPPLVGFLATGFILNTYGIASGDMLNKLSDLGITLLLFTVGLKLNLRTLIRPQVWAVTSIHMIAVTIAFSLALYGLALSGVAFLSDLTIANTLLIAFALSFSSTVFVVKVLEERSEAASLHGRIAIGILIMQDVAAVVYIAASTGQWPTAWALFVVLLIPLRPVLHQLLVRVGRGELLVLFGFLLALGGAEIFELFGLKGDLGALVLGVLIASHPKSDEMAKTMLGFKDLFLLGFFLSVGLSVEPTLEMFVIGALIAPFVFFKSALYFALMTAFHLRARTALLASLNLTNYSEFGLIVAAIGTKAGWIDDWWLVVIAIAMSLTFAMAAALNLGAHRIYERQRAVWKRFERPQRLDDDQLLDIGDATIAIIGMGGVGTGAYDSMRQQYGDTVVGIDIDPVTCRNQRATGRNVLLGDPSDADFWDRMQETHNLGLVMLALPKVSTSLEIIEELKASSFSGTIAATAKFPDEEEALQGAGATIVFNIYSEAGAGFSTHVNEILQATP